jgi:hypothetical protein
MHPIERLRYVARSPAVSPVLAVREAAGAMSAFADDPHAVVTACRRLVDRHPTSAALWWFATWMLTADDRRAEARRLAGAISADTTAAHMRDALPEGARVCVLGWSEIVSEAVADRPDLEVLVVDVLGEGSTFAARLGRDGRPVADVPVEGLGAAAASSELVLLEAIAMGPTAALAIAGSRAAAATAHHAGVPVWIAAGVGRTLPGRLWQCLVDRAGVGDQPWAADVEVVPLDLIDHVAGPDGLVTVTAAVSAIDTPVAAELLRAGGE